MSSQAGVTAPKGASVSMPSSETGGVHPMSISTRLTDERERLLGMTDEERAWRRQWLKDQHLSPNEPAYVPEYYKQRFNPIRRFYRMPLDKLFAPLVPVLVMSMSDRLHNLCIILYIVYKQPLCSFRCRAATRISSGT